MIERRVQESACHGPRGKRDGKTVHCERDTNKDEGNAFPGSHYCRKQGMTSTPGEKYPVRFPEMKIKN
jgi:hypothetical protein